MVKLLAYDNLKSEVFAPFRALGNTVALIRLIDVAQVRSGDTLPM